MSIEAAKLLPSNGMPILTAEYLSAHGIAQRTIRVRAEYLKKFVDPLRQYTLPYYIDKETDQVFIKPTFVWGSDLTENQIVYLFMHELL